MHLEDRMHHLLATAWCGLLWVREREAKRQVMQQEMEKQKQRRGVKECENHHRLS